MSDKSKFVWFCVQDSGGKLIGSATKLERVEGEDVADFRDRVKEKKKNDLAHCDADRLEVWNTDGNKLVGDALLPDALVPDAPSMANALVVIAPSQPVVVATSGGSNVAALESE